MDRTECEALLRTLIEKTTHKNILNVM